MIYFYYLNHLFQVILLGYIAYMLQLKNTVRDKMHLRGGSSRK